jgi:hypothetical protein
MGCCRHYKVVFQDDFDAFDSSLWVPSPWHGATFPNGAIKVEDSVLTIRADYNATPRNWVEVTSLGPAAGSDPFRPNAKRWQEGYFETRIKAAAIPLTANAWVKLTAWFFSYEVANKYPGSHCPVLCGEWDMVENGIGGTLADTRHSSVLHRNTNATCSTADTSHSAGLDGTNLLDWHVWGGLWRNNTLTTFLDGVWQSTHPGYDSTAQPMYMVFSAAPLGLVAPGHESDPEPDFVETYVDWVRVWQ